MSFLRVRQCGCVCLAVCWRCTRGRGAAETQQQDVGLWLCARKVPPSQLLQHFNAVAVVAAAALRIHASKLHAQIYTTVKFLINFVPGTPPPPASFLYFSLFCRGALSVLWARAHDAGSATKLKLRKPDKRERRDAAAGTNNKVRRSAAGWRARGPAGLLAATLGGTRPNAPRHECWARFKSPASARPAHGQRARAATLASALRGGHTISTVQVPGNPLRKCWFSLTTIMQGGTTL